MLILWMAQVASQCLVQMQDPELSINQAIADYLLPPLDNK